MPRDPWTDAEPQPGDFDADLEAIDPRYVEAQAGNPDAKLTSVTSAQDQDADPSARRPRRSIYQAGS